MSYLDNLLTLADNIRNKKHQEVEILEEDMTNLINNLSLLQKSKNGIPDSIASEEKLLSEAGLYFSLNKERYILYLSTIYLRWNWGKYSITRLDGGFAFNGFIDMIAFKNDFWQFYLDNYEEHEQNTTEELALIQKLKWFEAYEYPTTTRHSDIFGCIVHEPPNFPNQFYCYSNGMAMPLSFSTFDEYINALIASCGVKYWQYFYIEPEVLIVKNKKKKYVTHLLSNTSMLNDDLDSFTYREDVKIDRLDLINEYFAHSLKHLPELFPFADFTYHQNYYKRFKELYEASKEE